MPWDNLVFHVPLVCGVLLERLEDLPNMLMAINPQTIVDPIRPFQSCAADLTPNSLSSYAVA